MICNTGLFYIHDRSYVSEHNHIDTVNCLIAPLKKVDYTRGKALQLLEAAE